MTTTDTKDRLSLLMLAAAELQALGAIRLDHLERWSAFRTALEQAQADAANPPPMPEPLKALQALTDQVQTLAALVDLQGDKLDALAEHAGIDATETAGA